MKDKRDKKEKSAQTLVDVMRDLVRDEINKTSQMILCEVDSVNADGTANIFIVPDTQTLIKNIPNNTPHSLKSGDSVYLMKINNQIANSFIIRKSAEKSGSENITSDTNDVNDAIKRIENQYQILSKEGLTKSSLWKSVYPVGTVYESVDLDFIPSEHFSGSWKMLNSGLYENNSITQPLPLYEDKVDPSNNIYESWQISFECVSGFYAAVKDNTISIYTDDDGTAFSDYVDIPLPDSITMSLAGPYLFSITKKNQYSSLGITDVQLIRKEIGIDIKDERDRENVIIYPYSSVLKINAMTVSKQVIFISPFSKLRTDIPGLGFPMFKKFKSETYIRIHLAQGVRIGENTPIVLEAHLVRWPRRWYRSS